jgi:hypothetical protein
MGSLTGVVHPWKNIRGVQRYAQEGQKSSLENKIKSMLDYVPQSKERRKETWV